MAAPAATARELDAYREGADRFLAELDEEYYLHFAGLKDTLELEPIYERHAGLTGRDRVDSIGAAVGDSSRVRELWRFACEGYIGAARREHDERIAALEAELTASLDGEEIPFRALRSRLANEPDRERRERLDRSRVELTEEHLLPVQLEAWQAAHLAAADLGGSTYLDLYRRFGFPLDELAGQCEEVLEATERLYEQSIDSVLRSRARVGLDEAARWDVTRVFRAPEWDRAFPGPGMLPALEGTLADLGIDLRGQRNIQLDLEQRPRKTPRAFCAPIEIPERVVLVIAPIGGVDDWGALFHEAGHAEHFAHTSSSLSVEERRLGDNAVTEGWAALLDGLTSDPAWLSRRLDVPRPHDFAAESAATYLYRVRRYCAKLLYELELHAAADVAELQPRYVELISEALKIEPSEADYLGDVDAGFYASSYLRSWAFEAHMRTFLREQFGAAWFSRREAGSLLRELWSLGQSQTADELLGDVVGTSLELDAVVDRAAEALR